MSDGDMKAAAQSLSTHLTLKEKTTMVRKITLMAMVSLIALSLAGTALAEPTGNDRKGKYTYRKVYKACMERGEVSSEKPSLSPDAKTMAQWSRVFDSKDFDQFGCKPEWSKLSDEEVMDIYTYLYNHAADSPSPAKCK
jgi:hypothetical protein